MATVAGAAEGAAHYDIFVSGRYFGAALDMAGLSIRVGDGLCETTIRQSRPNFRLGTDHAFSDFIGTRVVRQDLT